MRRVSLSEARAKLSTLIDEVHKGRGPVAITQRSKVKAILVDAKWHGKVEGRLGFYRKTLRRRRFRLAGTMKIVRGLDQALEELKRERVNSVKRAMKTLE